jgi:hypothetical protein
VRFFTEEPVDNWHTTLPSVLREAGLHKPMFEALIALGICETFIVRGLVPPWEAGVLDLVWLLCRLSGTVGGARRLDVTVTYYLLEELFCTYIMDQGGMQAGCSFVSFLLNSEGCVERLKCTQVVEGVVDALRTHRAVEIVVVAGIMAIARMARYRSPEIHRKLVTAGAVEVLKQAMDACPCDSNTRDLGNQTIQLLFEGGSDSG